MVRHNLGWMYSTQNLSALAIRYLTEVVAPLTYLVKSKKSITS